MTASAVAVHWLVQVARRAGLDGADELEIVPQIPPVQAWDAVARHCGVSGEALVVEVAAFFRLKVANLEIGDPVVTKLIEESLVRKHNVLPLRQSDREIVVATSDPTDIAIGQEIGLASSRLPVFEVAPPRAIHDALDRRYGAADSIEQLLGTLPGDEMTEPGGDAGPERILVMDDDAVNRGLARTLLEASGFIVSEAENGEQGLAELMRNGRYDLIVIDLDMPVLDGRGVLKAVREMPEVSSLPVIVLTGSEPDDSEIELINLGADDYIRKPIDPPRFVARVKATLRRAAK